MKKIVMKKMGVLILLYFIIVLGVLMVNNRMKNLNNINTQGTIANK